MFTIQAISTAKWNGGFPQRYDDRKSDVKINEVVSFPPSLPSGMDNVVYIVIVNADRRPYEDMMVQILPKLEDQKYFEIIGSSGIVKNIERSDGGWDVYLNTVYSGAPRAYLTVNAMSPIGADFPLEIKFILRYKNETISELTKKFMVAVK